MRDARVGEDKIASKSTPASNRAPLTGPSVWHGKDIKDSKRWIRDTCCEKEVALAERMDEDPYVLLDKLAEGSPVGANRLLF